MRRKPGQHLSQDGIDLARLVGAGSGPYSLVVTSPIPRAVETAIAMGFEVDETDDFLGLNPVGVRLRLAAVVRAISDAVRAGAGAAKGAGQMAGVWRSIVERIPESTQALVVTHGGIVEMGAVAAVPDESARGLGRRHRLLRGRSADVRRWLHRLRTAPRARGVSPHRELSRGGDRRTFRD